MDRPPVFHQLLEFARHQFLFGFLRHFPLVLVGTLLVLAIVGRIGSSIGVPELIWPSQSIRRIRNGIALGHALLLIPLVAFMLEQPVRWNHSPDSMRVWIDPPTSFRIGTEFGPMQTRPMYWYLFATFISATTLGGFLLGVYRGLSRSSNSAQVTWSKSVAFTAGLIFSCVLCFGGIEFVRWLQPLTTFEFFGYRVDLAEYSPNEAGFHIYLFLHFAITLFFAFACSADSRNSFAIPAMVVSVVVMLLVHAYGFIAFWHGSMWPLTIATLAGVFLYRLAQSKGYRHQFRGFGNAYEKPVILNDNSACHVPPELIPLPWFGGLPNNEPVPLIIVSVSGVGSSSALWVNLVLERLNLEFPGFTYRIHLIAGSGGASLGAALHVSTLQEPQSTVRNARWAFNGQPTNLRELSAKLTTDAFASVIRTGFLDDPIRSFVPGVVRRNRGDALEIAWRTIFGDQLETTFRSLIDGERAGWRPSLAFAPKTSTGERLLISNRDLGPLTYLGESPIGWEVFRAFANQGILPITTAVRMSSGIPILSPESSLPSSPPIRISNQANDDAGMVIANAWLEESLRHPDMLKTVASKILLIRISDQPLSSDHSPMIAGIARGFYEAQGPDYFHVAEFINPVRGPSSWFVPEENAKAMERAIEATGDTAINKVFGRLQAWLRWPRPVGGIEGDTK